MGWCSGTDIFDMMVLNIYGLDVSEEIKEHLIEGLVKALEDQDWDCQSDSAYADDEMVRRVFKKLHPKW